MGFLGLGPAAELRVNRHQLELGENTGIFRRDRRIAGPIEIVTGDLLTSMDARQKAFVATKVWTTGKAAGVDQMQQSMRLLQTDRIDLMQVHNLADMMWTI